MLKTVPKIGAAVGRLALPLSLLAAAYPAAATTYVVDSLADTVAADGALTLREALTAANTNAASGDAAAGEADGDVITFDGTAIVATMGARTITLGGTELSITDDVTINLDDDAVTITIDAADLSRVFNINTAAGAGSVQKVSIGGMVLKNGLSLTDGGAVLVAASTEVDFDGVSVSDSDAQGAAATNGGGGIYNAGTLSLTGGAVNSNTASGAAGSGGGIFNAGTLTLDGVNVNLNSANRAGGGIEAIAGSLTTIKGSKIGFAATASTGGNTAGDNPGNGGGLHITGAGDAVITASEFRSNVAAREGGGVWNGSGTMTISMGTIISGNTASGDAADDGGGGLFNNGGTLNMTGGRVENNVANGTAGSGGAVLGLGGSTTLTDVRIANNTANRAGGGIELAGAAALTLDNVVLLQNNVGVAPAVAAPGNGGGLHVSGTGTVDIEDSMITENLAALEGGGLWNQAGTTMTVDGSTVSSNTASGAAADDGGGGIFNNGGDLVVTDSRIENNVADGASGSGGGIHTLGGSVDITGSKINGNVAPRAGGAIEASSTATVTLTSVTADDNTAGAVSSTVVANPGNGGGIHVSGGVATVDVLQSTFSNNTAAKEGGGLWNFAGSTMNVTNSTVSGNTANGTTTAGGGIFNQPGGLMTIRNATIANNSAASFGGGIQNAGVVTDVNIANSIISDNTADGDTAPGNDLSGSFTINTSIVLDPDDATLTGAGNLTGEDNDPNLGSLALRGGLTATHSIPADTMTVDNSAHDGGDNVVCAAAPVSGIDQRGVLRDDGSCDIGAFEVTDAPTVAAIGDAGAAITAGAGDTDVILLTFGLNNTSTESIIMRGYNGTLTNGGGAVSDIAVRHLYVDANANGVIDAGEVDLVASGDAAVTFNANGQSFGVRIEPGRTIAAGSQEQYILAVDINSTLSTASLALMFGAFGLIGVAAMATRRRKLLVAVAALAAGVSLSACDNDDNNNAGGGAGGAKTLQPQINVVDAIGASSGAAVTGVTLPISGNTVTLN